MRHTSPELEAACVFDLESDWEHFQYSRELRQVVSSMKGLLIV